MTKSLRLLYSAPVFPKVSETFVTDQIIGLHRLGHRIDVFTQNTSQIEDSGLRRELAASIGNLYLPPGTPQKRIPAWLPARRMPSWVKPTTWMKLARVATNPGFHRHRYPLKRGAALLQAPDYDVIVCHFGPAGVALQQMRDIGLLRAPLVTVFHGYDVSNFMERVSKEYYDRLFARGDLFLPISRLWSERLAELGCPVERTRVQRLGTDLNTFTHEVRFPGPGQGLRLLSVARLVEKKGIEFGIRAVADLVGRGMKVQYDIVGDGPLRESLEALSRDLGLSDAVHFLGSRPHAEITSLMQDHHVLMVPSVTDSSGGKEGIPVVIMEAMATGLLVVATRHSGIPEIVGHGETGLLAEERNPAELAEHLNAILNDQDRWISLVHAAKKMVHANYDLRRQNERLAGILEGLQPDKESGAPGK
jgi:colanic acid/amylovoran biosynthesis glycosyltransferase